MGVYDVVYDEVVQVVQVFCMLATCLIWAIHFEPEYPAGQEQERVKKLEAYQAVQTPVSTTQTGAIVSTVWWCLANKYALGAKNLMYQTANSTIQFCIFKISFFYKTLLIIIRCSSTCVLDYPCFPETFISRKSMVTYHFCLFWIVLQPTTKQYTISDKKRYILLCHQIDLPRILRHKLTLFPLTR